MSAFYPPGSVEQIAQRVASSGALQRLVSEWRLPMEIAHDLVKLSLFDTILYLDDSGSMQFEEGGSRIDDLKLIVSRVAMAASLFDQDGIQVRAAPHAKRIKLTSDPDPVDAGPFYELAR